jgi:hypothetical protein
MDMRRFSGSHIKVDDVRDGPLNQVIAAIKMGKYDKPDLVFETGDLLSLNATNNSVLVRAYGPNDADWIGKEIELFHGEIEYQGKMQEAVLVRPISPPLKPSAWTPLKPSDKKKPAFDYDDEIASENETNGQPLLRLAIFLEEVL